uniref:aldehyde oxygenase (deformylating) n=1 Tax=Ananas comosus var. bracteatus TaxID=296719 RepID=A0A6V7NQL8_ANACO|nr:unnamed protein product [Ananas comosus var. bracteatus]
MVSVAVTRTSSIIAFLGYLVYIDFMNYMGHCNFEIVPKWLFGIFPPLKYLMYTPSFHSLHHTNFRTNYSLFMPLYDYIYGTYDKSSDHIYERSLKGKEERPDVGDELNGYGKLYVKRNPTLKLRIVDGTSLAVALVLNNIPKGINNVLLIGKPSKMAYTLSLALCQREVQVEMVQKDLYELMLFRLPLEMKNRLVLSKMYTSKHEKRARRTKDGEGYFWYFMKIGRRISKSGGETHQYADFAKPLERKPNLPSSSFGCLSNFGDGTSSFADYK